MDTFTVQLHRLKKKRHRWILLDKWPIQSTDERSRCELPMTFDSFNYSAEDLIREQKSQFITRAWRKNLGVGLVKPSPSTWSVTTEQRDKSPERDEMHHWLIMSDDSSEFRVDQNWLLASWKRKRLGEIFFCNAPCETRGISVWWDRSIFQSSSPLDTQKTGLSSSLSDLPLLLLTNDIPRETSSPFCIVTSI